MSKKKKELKTTTLTSPASGVEPWVVEQLSKRPKESWVRDQLQAYYSKEMLDLKLEALRNEMNARLTALEADADDTQRVVIEQRGKWSKAPKRHEVDDLKTAVTGWSAWFRRTLIGVILFLVGTGSVTVWKYAELSVLLGESNKRVNELVGALKESEATQAQMEKQLDLLGDMIKHQQSMWGKSTTE